MDVTTYLNKFHGDTNKTYYVGEVGEKVKIVYDQQDDDEVKTISFWGLYRWTIILSCIAAPLLIIGGGYLLYLRS